MKVIVKPEEEKKVLAPVSKDAKPEEIRESVVAKAQCCVDHLCGCRN
jgi:hypothetical protein